MPDPRRQFRVLYRDAVRRLVDLELLSSQGQIENLLAQAGALLAAFSLVLAQPLVRILFFSTISKAQIIEQSWGVHEFMISTTIAVVGLFAVVAWESLLPSRVDSLVLGMLPVRTTTIFSAKVAAIATWLGASVFAVHFFTAPLAPGSFFAFWLTMAAAALSTFCFLLSLQGLAAQLLPFRAFLRISNVLQVGAFFAILALFLLTPGPTDLDFSAAESRHLIRYLPSFWFLGLLQKLNGLDNTTFTPLAPRALWATLVTFSIAALTYALSYARTARRTIEQPDILPADRRKEASRWLPFLASTVTRTPLERALLLFLTRGLARSRQHRNILAAFAGLALAISLTFARSFLYGHSDMYEQARRYGFRVPSWKEVNEPFLAGAFVLISLLILGTRSSFALPIALKANWVLRITQVHSPKAYLQAIRRSMYAITVLPVLCVLAVVYFLIWPRLPVIGHLISVTLVSVILLERMLARFRKMPFACSYLPGSSNLKVRLGAYSAILVAGTYLAATIEYSMFETVARTAVWFLLLSLAAYSARRRWRIAVSDPYAQLQFVDAAIPEVSPLDLHEDSVYSTPFRYIDVLNAPPEPSTAQKFRGSLLRFAAFAGALLLIGAAYEQIAALLHPLPPRVGTAVDIGGRSLNMFCSGEGKPTVVFESGAGGPGIGWAYIQREAARFTQACWYDRAGYGWSDAGPYPRDGNVATLDLHTLLESSNVPRPYVLVGASYGGMLVRIFNTHYPREVAGMILVDSTHSDFTAPILTPGDGWIPYVPHLGSLLTRGLRWVGLLRLVMDTYGAGGQQKGMTPEEARLTTSFEPRTLAESSKELFYETALQARAASGLGDKPLVVLTAGLPPRAPRNGIEARAFRERQERWVEAQRQLTRLSSQSSQIVLNDSTHCIQCERPDSIIQAVRSVIEKVRATYPPGE